MSEPQVEQTAVVDPLLNWWAGKKSPKSQLTEQLEGSLGITEADIPKEAPVSEHEPVKQPAAEKPARKRRSDAGVAKGPKLVESKPAAGPITGDQKGRLLMLVAVVQQSTREFMLAEMTVEEKRRQMEQAQTELTAYLDSLSLSGPKS